MKINSKPRRHTTQTALCRAEASALRITAGRATRHSGEHLTVALSNADRLATKLTDEERSERRWRFETGHTNNLRRLGRLGRS